MLASTSRPDLRTRSATVAANTSAQPAHTDAMKPGCQSCSQLAVAVTLNSSAGSASQTTKRLSSFDAASPRRPLRRQT